jgi:hypothetical protein
LWEILSRDINGIAALGFGSVPIQYALKLGDNSQPLRTALFDRMRSATRQQKFGGFSACRRV